jgi:uncharacterized protein YmfQ (DUF2313 family)
MASSAKWNIHVSAREVQNHCTCMQCMSDMPDTSQVYEQPNEQVGCAADSWHAAHSERLHLARRVDPLKGAPLLLLRWPRAT